MKKFSLNLVLIFCVLSLNAQNSVSLKLNPQKDKIYNTKLNVTQEVFRSGKQGSLDVKVNSLYDVNYKLLEQEGKEYLFEFGFNNVDTDMDFGGNGKEKDNEPVELDLSKCKVIARFTESGIFIRFTNYPEFQNNIQEAINTKQSPVKEELQKEFKVLMNENELRSLFEPLFAFIPEKEVKVKDEWTKSYIYSLGQLDIVFANTYKLDKIENNLMSISCNSILESMPNEVILKNGTVKKSFSATGNSSSTLLIEQSTGLAKEGIIKTHVDGTTKIINPEKEVNVEFTNDIQTKIN